MAADEDEVERLRAVAIWNERLKATATYLNGVAVACFAVGGITPFISVLVLNQPGNMPAVGLIAGICVPLSAILHSWARWTLKDIRS